MFNEVIKVVKNFTKKVAILDDVFSLLFLKILLTLKEPVAVITNSTYLVLVFKMLAKQRKINAKMFTSKKDVESNGTGAMATGKNEVFMGL